MSVTDYGTIDYDHVKNNEVGFINENSRKAQDTAMLHDCTMNSLSKEGKAKLNVNDDLYKFGRRQAEICSLNPDSNATSSMIRIKLANLDEYIVQANMTSPSSIITSKFKLKLYEHAGRLPTTSSQIFFKLTRPAPISNLLNTSVTFSHNGKIMKCPSRRFS